MKKIFLSIVLFLLSPMFVHAADVHVDKFLVNAEILENGDMNVEELIFVKGDFNWYERDILYANSKLTENTFQNSRLYNASDIINIEIKAKYTNDINFDTFKEQDFDNFKMTAFGTNGEKGKYTISNITNGYRYRIYYYTNNKSTAIYIKYTVKDAVVMHEDVSELYWTFVPDGFEENLNNIEIRVHLPKEDTSDLFRIWAHGNLSGEVSFIGKSGIKATISEVMEGESVDIRTTFSNDLITSCNKKSNITALDKIIEVETKRAQEANELREELKAKYNFVKYGTITFYIGVVLLGIFIYFKYGRSPKSSYFSKYNREFIDDYNVEVIDYLMKKKITPNALTASIMNLIYKKNISAKELAEENKKNKDYEFTLENTDNLNDSENILVEFLFDKVGAKNSNEENKKVFTTKDLKTYSSGVKTCDKFISSYTKWKNDVIKKGKQEAFYESFIAPKIIGTIALMVGMVLFIQSISYETDFFPAYFLPFIGIIFLIYTLVLDRKTKKGALHYDKWNAFKNFLNDFGSFELKELPEIVLWERYLVYATIFGLADKVEKSMNVHIKEIEASDTYVDYYPSFYYINLGHTINNSVNNAVHNAYERQAANYANSHSSSSSGGGFGGGFSSGGGFGGGGGGGRFG